MKRAVVMLAMILGLVGFACQSWAASTDTITVTVSLTETVSVSLDSNAWAIGAIGLGGSDGPESYVATNNGNVAIDLDIRATNGAGGWTLAAAAGANAFSVHVSSPALNLSTSDQTLATNVAVSGTKGIDMTYNAPTSDTHGGGVEQGFTISVAASAYVP